MPADLANLEQELREQHPELRLRLLDAAGVSAWCGMMAPETPGAYDCWEINALDDHGTGFTASVAIGNPFDPAYRKAVRHYRAGRFPGGGALRRKQYCATRLAVLEHGKVIARHYEHDADGKVTTDCSGRDFRIGSDVLRFRRHADLHWTVTIDAPTLHHGLNGFLQPRRQDAGRVYGTLNISPDTSIVSMSRALLPDSPGGSTHDWLIAAPRMECSGELAIHAPATKPRQFNLRAAVGTIDSFRGNGPLGEGMRRYFLSHTNWPGGAAIGELVIIRKYIQIAPTLLIFTDNGQVRILRCDRAPRTSFQRSKWLLGYPLTLTWQHEGQRWQVEHALQGLNESTPCRSLAITRTMLTGNVGQNDELIESRRPGTVRLIQPSRIDSLLWRWWLTVP